MIQYTDGRRISNGDESKDNLREYITVWDEWWRVYMDVFAGVMEMPIIEYELMAYRRMKLKPVEDPPEDKCVMEMKTEWYYSCPFAKYMMETAISNYLLNDIIDSGPLLNETIRNNRLSYQYKYISSNIFSVSDYYYAVHEALSIENEIYSKSLKEYVKEIYELYQDDKDNPGIEFDVLTFFYKPYDQVMHFYNCTKNNEEIIDARHKGYIYNEKETRNMLKLEDIKKDIDKEEARAPTIVRKKPTLIKTIRADGKFEFTTVKPETI
jgi:hypothetical protein